MSADTERPLVSICTITYNHEQYIEEAICGVLNQERDFRIEFVIGDDCSKDNTRAIIDKYHKEYPDIIVPLYPKSNIGAKANSVECLLRCTGKYIAFLEGDDKWIDTTKLKRQVKFLEENPGYSMCFTDVEIINNIGTAQEPTFLPPPKEDIEMEEVVMSPQVFIPTATLFFRNNLPSPLPKFFKEANSGDIAMHIMFCDMGTAKYLPGKTAAYRQHGGGVTRAENHSYKSYRDLFKLYSEANVYYRGKYDSVFSKRLAEMSKTVLMYYSKDKRGTEKLKHVLNNCPLYFRYAPFNLKELLYFAAVLFFPVLLRSKK